MRFPGHPDAACDLVAEAIVDEYLRRDPASRLRVHVQGGHGALFITGDVLSQADLDVATIAKRALANAGVMSDVEPFVALEPAASEQVAHMRFGGTVPVHVMGYATTETPEAVPTPLAQARRLARELEGKRSQDETWFWLGADGEVSVSLAPGKAPLVHVRIEHCAKPLTDARQELTSTVQALLPGAEVRINVNGEHPVRGLAQVCGASGKDLCPYGHGLPSVAPSVGLDAHDARKAGPWLARAAACAALRATGAKAVMVQATYLPGEDLPTHALARDERGRDVTTHISFEAMALSRVAREWWRPGLSCEAARWGYAGSLGLPWEG